MDELKQLIDNYRDDLIKKTQEIIQIKSVEETKKPGMPFGEGVHKALEYALSLAEEMGFTTKNLEGYAGYGEMGEGKETIGVLGHLDVVPEGDDWTYPPYGGEIHDGKIYGRGTIDNKGPMIAVLFAMKALKESNIPIHKKIRIIFGTNEESGMQDIPYYLSKEKAPDLGFTPDADFPVIHGEKGIQILSLNKKWRKNCDCTNSIKIKSIRGGTRVNVVPDFCEAILELNKVSTQSIKDQLDSFIKKTGFALSLEEKNDDILIKSTGKSAHGSTPEKGQNAISQLLSFLAVLEDCQCDILELIHIYNRKIGMEYYGESIGCGFEDDVSGKLTFNVGTIDVNEDGVTMKINIRYPITIEGEKVVTAIEEKLRGTGLQLRVEEDAKPLYVPKEHMLVQKLMEVYKEETGDKHAEAITIGGGTYARTLANTVAFGPMFPGDEDVVHQKDEYISIDNLLKITYIYAKALYELSR
ncbi:MAG: dipeptidase PepV [Clostridiaceae bacterium]|nr:dipeptidase PepV [Clostridiaceae bacterium]